MPPWHFIATIGHGKFTGTLVHLGPNLLLKERLTGKAQGSGILKAKFTRAVAPLAHIGKVGVGAESAVVDRARLDIEHRPTAEIGEPNGLVQF